MSISSFEIVMRLARVSTIRRFSSVVIEGQQE
jgi:hypothetical protein